MSFEKHENAGMSTDVHRSIPCVKIQVERRESWLII